MSVAVEAQIYNSFKGIREFNGVNAGGAISALTCTNVELIQSEIGNYTGIKSMEGNTKIYKLPANYTCIELFETIQDNINYTIIYGEDETKGTLYYIGVDKTLKILVDNLTKTGNANGLTMYSSAYDVFVFTNGEEIKTIAFTTDSNYYNVVKEHNPVEISDGGYIADINAKDSLGRTIKGLAIAEWNGFLVIATNYGIASSHQNDVYKWDDIAEDIADSWYIDFSKKITALASFTGGLYIFTKDDCSLLNVTPNDTTNSKLITSSGIGCFSYKSIVKHDTYLFFYDSNQKNIYYLGVTDTTGQTKPTGPVAKEIQSFFSRVERFKMYSCIYDTHNEIWCLVNDKILIFDYAQQEWITRAEQELNSIVLINNSVLSGDVNGNIRVERVGSLYSESYYPSEYKTTYINIGSSTNLKKQKTPLLLVLNANYTQDFYVQLICNGKEKNPKKIKVKQSNAATFGGAKFGVSTYAGEGVYNKKVVEISTPQTWYTLGVKIYTKELGQGFYIDSMELKNIKAKTKTRGR